ncbi:hypothetical protein PPL_03992 [Heterostelium album PN500]|uniref:Uncharacterized protein n=1 Tax=Heterostelium pallidum (strain ATCC 26659 / Pp 5 / PN500) TaxID=670386 RepID=D3B5Q4_HETP5|nr:hypothetical protein PPL_03992 [Heterostelium album PN500]EFA83202.1 hypothetical protein PPL_03992 [Heterostelium album PN500]|eukprot:XP_020435319.1 hypothetical protein PPL_03992 [Heterostelium album PN500]
MKIYINLSIALLLLLFCSSALGFDEVRPDIQNVTDEDIEKHHRCHDNKKGYESAYAVTSFNGLFPSGNGTYVPTSFQEFGFLSVDFHQRRMMIRYFFRMSDGCFNGTIWAFNKTNTMYLYQDGSCKKLPLSFEVPGGFPKHHVHYWGKTHLGAFPVILLRVDASVSQNLVNQTVIFDPHGCAPVTTISKNLDPKHVGYSNMEFFEYKSNFDSKHFKLPSECNADDEGIDNNNDFISVSHNKNNHHEQDEHEHTKKTPLSSIIYQCVVGIKIYRDTSKFATIIILQVKIVFKEFFIQISSTLFHAILNKIVFFSLESYKQHHHHPPFTCICNHIYCLHINNCKPKQVRCHESTLLSTLLLKTMEPTGFGNSHSHSNAGGMTSSISSEDILSQSNHPNSRRSPFQALKHTNGSNHINGLSFSISHSTNGHSSSPTLNGHSSLNSSGVHAQTPEIRVKSPHQFKPYRSSSPCVFCGENVSSNQIKINQID